MIDVPAEETMPRDAIEEILDEPRESSPDLAGGANGGGNGTRPKLPPSGLVETIATWFSDGPPISERAATRRNNIGFIRLVLASLVIYTHSMKFSGHIDRELLAVLTHNDNHFGRIAVDAFFALSGFLVLQSWQNSATGWQFMAKRILRIMPAFLVCSIACAAFLFPAAYPGMRFDGLKSIESAVYHTVTLFVPRNGVTWTIRYESVCYLLVACFGLVGLYKHPKAVLGITFAAVAVHLWSAPQSRATEISMWNIPRLFAYYLLGMSVYLYSDKIRMSPRIAILCGLAICATFVFGGFTDILPIAGTYLLFWFAFGRIGPISKFERFGDFSYGTYLYGLPVTYIVLRYAHLTGELLALTAFACTLPIAIASWFLIERPALSLKPKGKRKTAVTT
jgi:peptidoglycan/LPS O-acetylase OafA/YrhL